MEFLESLQEEAAQMGYIHDPVFYFGEVADGFVLGTVFQVVSPSTPEAMVSGLGSFSELIEGKLPEENPYDRLVYYAIHQEWDDTETEEESEDAADGTD